MEEWRIWKDVLRLSIFSSLRSKLLEKLETLIIFHGKLRFAKLEIERMAALQMQKKHTRYRFAQTSTSGEGGF